MHEQVRYSQRQALDRRGEVIALGVLAGRSAEKAPDHVARQMQAQRLAQVEDPGLGHRAGQSDARLGARGPARKPAPGGSPEGEVPARRVSDREDTGQVDSRLQGAEPVDPLGNVLERGGPAPAAAPAQAAVFQVPHRPPATGEIGDERVLEPSVVAVPPEATVDQDGDRQRGAALDG